MRRFLICMVVEDSECTEEDKLKDLKSIYQNEVFDNGYQIDFKILEIAELPVPLEQPEV